MCLLIITRSRTSRTITLQVLCKNIFEEETETPNTSERVAQEQPVANQYIVKASCRSGNIGSGLRLVGVSSI